METKKQSQKKYMMKRTKNKSFKYSRSLGSG